MTRLAFAIGFLSVFGIVAYAVVILLSKTIKDSTPNKSQTKKEEKHDESI